MLLVLLGYIASILNQIPEIMTEAESKSLVAADCDLDKATSSRVKLAEGGHVSQTFVNSDVNTVGGDLVKGDKIVHIHNTILNVSTESSQAAKSNKMFYVGELPESSFNTNEDISVDMSFEEGWEKIAPSIYVNYSKPLKKGARVYPGKQILDKAGRDVAIKIIDHNDKNWDEVTHLLNLEHANIIRMYDAGKFKKGSQQFIYIVMQLCPQTLQEFINENKHEPFTFKRYFSYAKQIVKGVRFIHEKGILHRNIDLENILVFPSNDRCGISDFGLSKQLQEGQSVDPVSSQKTFTEGFKAPEIHADPSTYSIRSDAFSIGIVISMLFSEGVHPYGRHDFERQASIVNNKPPDLSSVGELMEPYPEKREQLLDLILTLLSHDPKGRLEPKKILEHAFFLDSSRLHRNSTSYPALDKDNLQIDESRDHAAVSMTESDSDNSRTETDDIQLSDSVVMRLEPIKENVKRVYKGRHTETDLQLAIKLLDKSKESEREVEILARLSHENIVKIIEVGKCEWKVPWIYIAMELYPENLADHIRNNKDKPFDFHKSFNFSKQLVTAVSYLHGERIVHRDLKPWNVLVAKDGKTVKLTDMGLSRMVTDGESKTKVSYLEAGSDGFKAPETYKNADKDNGGEGNGTYAYSCDIFPLAINIYYIFSNGEHPFGSNQYLCVANIIRCIEPNLTQIKIVHEQYTAKRDQLIELLKAMLDNDRKKRPSAREILEKDFFKKTNEGYRVDPDLVVGISRQAAIGSGTTSKPSNSDEYLETLKEMDTIAGDPSTQSMSCREPESIAGHPYPSKIAKTSTSSLSVHRMEQDQDVDI